MKVLHLVQKPQLRGAEVFTSQLASHINEAGHKASITFVFPGKAELPFTGSVFHLNGNPKRRLIDTKAWQRLAQIIRENQPDIIQANAGDTLKYAVFSKLLFRWKQPIVFRNASTISLYIKTWWAKKWNSFFFRQTDHIISVSKTSALDFAALFPQFKNRVSTIPIGIETEELQTPANNSDQVFKLLSVSAPVLIHVGGFTYEKNHSGLISIFEKILVEHPNAQLHLLGDGPLRTSIEAIVQKKNLTNQVHFHGFRKNALQYIRNAQVLILPSLIEGLPGVILEAFYCKTPVVAYNVGGIKEIVINDETGRLIPKGDEESFTTAVIDALERTSYNQTLINNAYKLVTEQYLNSRIATSFLEVYKAVIEA